MDHDLAFDGKRVTRENPLPVGSGRFLPSVISRYEKALQVNATSGSFAALTGTATRPAASATRAVWRTRVLAADLLGYSQPDFDFAQGTQRELQLNGMTVIPYGGNANNDVVNYKLIGWNQTKSGMWVAEMKCEVQGTLSSALTGVGGHDVGAADMFCDTCTLTTGVAVLFTGTADVDPAYFKVGISGFEFVELLFDMGAGGDGGNALVRFDA